MAFEIKVHEQERPIGLVADRRLCLTADKERVVEADDVSAAYLFAPEGTEIQAADVARLGLEYVDGQVVQRAANEPPEPAAPPADSAEGTAAASKPPQEGKRKRGG